ncbi:glycine cleavage system protein T [Bacillus sp. VT 712]|uniref:Aminomethyltransferase n=1 Tax=Priestia veravalensis TaxID=1414648 RepID=A0A0V8JN96_9BACI|nr:MULTISPECIES: glycine cleavage system aminomethyltransferase GcvT [Bacillaceae]KSU88440.1 glycine cleavage system protein T [Priestia veravalensis]KZB93130.1 glycine cleavage system protein T [Bacillus sp. VT 712]SCC12478.1 aminomethyltransferase [Priestia flexa]
MTELNKTPLYDVYQQYGGKIIDFGGWALPVQFSSIKEEHHAVRTKAGLFDVSHMGEFDVKGTTSLAFLQKVMTNDVSVLRPGKALYTAMCYEDGGTVDDLLVYQKGEDDYLLVVNAANIEKDFEWLQQHKPEGIELVNRSSEFALLALQGPAAQGVLQKLTDESLSDLKPFTFKDDVEVAGVRALVSRTGYTGEDGFELYCSASDVVTLWTELLKNEEVVPCGLGARDTLRFEATLALYGQELSKDITPIEARIGFAVKTDKEDFIGKEVLKRQREEGPNRKLVGLEMIDKGIPRHGYEVFSEEEEIGFVTTGTQSPTLNKNIGLALIDAKHAELGTEVYVQVRKRRLKAKVVKTPFYKRSK